MPKPIRYCSVPHCEIRCHSLGYCSRHYQAFRKYGDATKVLQKQHHGKTVRERFLIYTKQGPGCWEWVGHKDPNGYGRLNIGGKPILAHRISYMLQYGDVPDEMDVLHKCDTPKCVNPEHLFLGTQADNVRDMHEKGRALKRGLKGTEHNLAKLDEAAVRAIRASTEPDGKVAAAFGIARTTVSDIRKRRSWAHIE